MENSDNRTRNWLTEGATDWAIVGGAADSVVDSASDTDMIRDGIV